jgi:hypothetical protein
MSHRILRRHRARRVPLAGLLSATALFPVDASAQNAQMVSLQLSGLYGAGLDGMQAGYGWEAQLRLHPTSFSIGAGAEQTFHESDAPGRDVDFLGGFLEPRYGFDMGPRTTLYVSGRLSLIQVKLREGSFESSATGYHLGAGAGLTLGIGAGLRLDANLMLGYRDMGIVEAPGGPSGLGTDTVVVGRVGVGIGVG